MMGSVASIHVHEDAPIELVDVVIAEVFAELEKYEAMFSTFRLSSEVSRINRKELHLLEASREVIDVLDACFFLEGASDGAFSTRRHDGSLDPAGFVKGWAVERASQRFDAAGLKHWYVSLGGDMQMGDPPPNSHLQDGWKVGIADPLRTGVVVAALAMQRGAVATSGSAERGRHIIDQRSGVSSEYWSSITVTGPSLTWADAFATTAFVIGEEGLAWVHRFEGYAAMGVRPDGTLVTVQR
jgi:thiamine biosynthesis lipoprotein